MTTIEGGFGVLIKLRAKSLASYFVRLKADFDKAQTKLDQTSLAKRWSIWVCNYENWEREQSESERLTVLVTAKKANPLLS